MGYSDWSPMPATTVVQCVSYTNTFLGQGHFWFVYVYPSERMTPPAIDSLCHTSLIFHCRAVHNTLIHSPSQQHSEDWMASPLRATLWTKTCTFCVFVWSRVLKDCCLLFPAKMTNNRIHLGFATQCEPRFSFHFVLGCFPKVQEEWSQSKQKPGPFYLVKTFY